MKITKSRTVASRKARLVKPTPHNHNPDNVTPAQLNPPVQRQWRLLDADEINPRRDTVSYEIQKWMPETKKWDSTAWRGGLDHATYRTRLTRAELAKLK